MALCLGLCGWDGTRKNFHPLTPILIITWHWNGLLCADVPLRNCSLTLIIKHPLSTSSPNMIHSILLVQFTYSTVLFPQPLRKLKKQQRKINYSPRSEHVLTEPPGCQHLNAQTTYCLPVKFCIIFRVATTMHNIFHQRSPPYLKWLQRRQLRSSVARSAVVLPTTTQFGRHAFSVGGQDICNSLPGNISLTDSFAAFRHAINTHLLNIAFI